MNKPTLSIVVPVYNVAEPYLKKCVESVRSQTDSAWELVLCDDASTDQDTRNCLEFYRGLDPRIRLLCNSTNLGIAETTNRAFEFTTGEFVGFLDNDDELHPDAVALIHQYLSKHPQTDILYTDEDKIDEHGRPCDSYYKPDWSPEHLQSCMYCLHFLVIRKAFFCKIGLLRSEFDGAQDYDLMLRASRKARKVGHISRILYHWRKIPGSASAEVNAKPAALENARRCLADVSGHQVMPGMLPGLWRVRPKLDGAPVTLLIPTNDSVAEVSGRGRINLLCNLLVSIQKKTTYQNIRVLIVDNDNMSSKTLANIKELGLGDSIRHYALPPGPFNFARKFNFCWPQVETEYLILLNDDLEIITPDWIEALLEPMQNGGVGAVGGKLLHAEGTIQHVGMVMGINNGTAHIYHGFPAEHIGYNGFTHVIRNYSAVTGACMLTRRGFLETLGGFDERFQIDYNDVDYCLRLNKLGFRCVYTPFAQLYHFEGATVTRRAPSEMDTQLFNEVWREVMTNDPYYNPNLPRDRHDYSHSL